MYYNASQINAANLEPNCHVSQTLLSGGPIGQLYIISVLSGSSAIILE